MPTDAPGPGLQILSDLIGISDQGDDVYVMPAQSSTTTVTNTVTEQDYRQRNIVLLVLGITVAFFLGIVAYMYLEISRLKKGRRISGVDDSASVHPDSNWAGKSCRRSVPVFRTSARTRWY